MHTVWSIHSSLACGHFVISYVLWRELLVQGLVIPGSIVGVIVVVEVSLMSG